MRTYTVTEILETLNAELEQLPDSERQLVFDCDGTLINGDVSETTGFMLMKSGLVDQELVPQEFRSHAVYTRMTLKEFHRARQLIESQIGTELTLEWEVFIQSGLPQELVIEKAHAAINHALDSKTLEFSGHLPELLKKNAKNSWIVSGSSYPTVVAIGERLGVDRNRVLATRMELIDGVYQRKFQDPGFVWEHNKVVMLERNGVYSPYFVAGDSVGDWHMMLKSKKWVWCVFWGASNRRSQELHEKVEKHLQISLPTEPGFYVYSHNGQSWVFELRSAPSIALR